MVVKEKWDAKALRNYTDSRCDALLAAINDLQQRFAGFNHRLTKIEKALDEIERELEAVAQEVEE